jgi:hypothetical protein
MLDQRGFGRPDDAHAVYRTPWATRSFAQVKRWVLTFFVLIVSFGLCMLAAVQIWSNGPPDWVFVACFALPLIPASAAFIWLARSAPSRLVMTADECTFGQRPFHHRVSYDDVRLIGAERPDKTVGKNLLLSVQAQRRRISIWLKHGEAEECFVALRECSPKAVAAFGDDAVLLPEDSSYEETAREALCVELRCKARRALWLALGSLAIALKFGVLSVVGGFSVQVLIPTVAFTLGAVAAMRHSIQLHQGASGFASGELDLEPLEIDDEFEEGDDQAGVGCGA